MAFFNSMIKFPTCSLDANSMTSRTPFSAAMRTDTFPTKHNIKIGSAFANCDSRVLHTTPFLLPRCPYIKDLLTECEVCTGKYCLRFSYRPSDEGARSVR